jgi:hypothetical protein
MAHASGRLVVIMPKFVCSYAHDIACFADFVVEAKSEAAALRKIRKALREGKFNDVEAVPGWENGSTNERVFVQGPASKHSTETTLEQLTGRTDGDAAENMPCQTQTIH